jgi:hypothetical protein
MRSYRRFLVFTVLVGAFATTSLAAMNDELSLYERIAARLAANPSLAKAIGTPPPELREAQWLVGRWNVTSRVFATQRTPERVDHGESVVQESVDGIWLQSQDSYDGRTDAISFITYDPVSRRWVSATMDRYGQAITSHADRWAGDKLVFMLPEVTLLGERTTLRQTIEKRSNDEYRILNEERLASGKWIAVDEYVYRRQK